ncbi:MAG: DASS family sodium-coupled anion symporter [Candidatus Schekmanbacteria bacterium]|nr:DASS family sodium-coupled anion symporter [Candidatus Schekmanbacteria bacterium]
MQQSYRSRPGWLSYLLDNSRFVIIALTLVIFFWVLSLPGPAGLSPEGLKSIAIFALCLIFWVTNVIPLMITSLLAIILFPMMGILDANLAYSLFGNKAVFFILGAFILASAIIRSGLSSRITLWVLQAFGQSPKKLLLGIQVLAAFLSFWMSEHAVVAMLFPIVLEIAESLNLVQGESNYGKCLFLNMGWGCVIGGIATFLGGARAPLAVGILNELTGKTIDFLPWALAALPTVIGLLIFNYFLLNKMFPAEIKDISVAEKMLKQKLALKGKASSREKLMGILMLFTIFAWIFGGEKIGLANIALAAVVVAFCFNLMKWKEVEEDVNWGILLMYGGAICLGFAMDKTGAAGWLAKKVLGNLGDRPYVFLSAFALLSIFLTEVMSNSAVIALLMPMAISLANSFNIDPRIVTLAITIPAGLAFCLPMGTPAVAITVSSGYVATKDTAKAGWILNIYGWIIFTVFMIIYWPLIGFKI